jgi:hypothetical protein
VVGSAGVAGAAGVAGSTGPTGPTGVTGPAGSLGASSRYFNYLSIPANTWTTLPTTMDLSLYDYEFDLTITGIVNNNWLYLRFNNDTGVNGWCSTLFFNPTNASSSAPNISAGTYNNNSNGTFVYWYNGGTVSTGPITMKGTYRLSAVNSTTFVVSLMNSQPINMTPSQLNNSPTYLIYATQIQYSYATNVGYQNATRWSPSSISINTSVSAYTTGNVLIREMMKTSSNPL